MTPASDFQPKYEKNEFYFLSIFTLFQKKILFNIISHILNKYPTIDCSILVQEIDA